MDPKLAYKAMVEFTTSAEATRWNRFLSYLTANSLLVLAWAMLYNTSSQEYWSRGHVVECALCAIGVIGAASWSSLGYRACRFHSSYMKMASHMENRDSENQKDPHMPFTVSLKIRHTAPGRMLGSSYYTLTLGPAIFGALYIVMLSASVGLQPIIQFIIALELSLVVCICGIIVYCSSESSPESEKCPACGEPLGKPPRDP